jgi:glycosyltransferase involved in cell wall biosynthesis
MPVSDKFTVGWVTDAKWPYRNVMASTRIRCLDIISFLKSRGISTGLYRSFKKYDTVIFQKSFSRRHYETARRLSATGTRIILDINVNYFEKKGETTQVKEEQIDEMHRFLDVTDKVLVSSHYLKDIAEKYHSNVQYMPEHIGTIGDHSPKILTDPVTLVYCGYAVKADSVLFIRDVLEELSVDHRLELMFVCDSDPSLRLPVKTSFVKYRQNDLINILRQGSIKIAPRVLDNSYDLGHSFTKIGYPMSVGLPVIASPVPSYMNSPALIASTKDEWLAHFRLLMEDPAEYKKLSQTGITFVRENYSIQKIGQMYINLFRESPGE